MFIKDRLFAALNLNDKEKYIKSIKDHKYDYEHDVIPNIEKPVSIPINIIVISSFGPYDWS